MTEAHIIATLAEWVQGARRGVAFTGAGISTESGVADFRSPGGVWSRHTPVMYDEFLASREARVRYWAMRRELHAELADARPNAGHLAIARLEQLGHLCGVVTQNIDGLHQMAGSSNVIEIHGTTRVVMCVSCEAETTPEETLARIEAGEEAPTCLQCGGPLKSKTISFGQPMPAAEMAMAFELSQDADLYVAMGSSLTVEPAASLPRLAKQYGARLVIINRDATPLDAVADLVIHSAIGLTLSDVLERMGV